MSGDVAALRALVREFPSALLGYSGGVDSVFLAVVLRQELGRERMLAVTGQSASYPAAQSDAAQAVARQYDIPVAALATHELEDERYLANPTNRCFFCKEELWTRLGDEARRRGIAVVCDGTNADDLREHRPGRAAGIARGVRSPLAEVGMTKQHVRTASLALGLPTWDAPAAPCLSSRVEYGLRITPRRLRQVEDAESFLRALGVTGDLRVRHHGERARIEAEARWVPWLGARTAEIGVRFRELGFDTVEIDPRGYRRGSLILDRGTR